MNIKSTIKDQINGNFPYPDFRGPDLIVYNFLVEENTEDKHDEGWILDLHTGEFKYPMEKLNQSDIFWFGTKKNGEKNNIKGTNIFWKIQNEMFVFWLKQ